MRSLEAHFASSNEVSARTFKAILILILILKFIIKIINYIIFKINIKFF